MPSSIPDSPPHMTPPTKTPSLAVYGLGIIGSRVADLLSAASYPLGTWSRSSRSRPDFDDDAAALADRSEVILFFLKDAPAVRETFEAIRPTLRSGKSLINHATIDLETTLFLESECRAAGCGFLNAPFTGSKVAAGNGKLVYYCGGDSSVLEDLRPILDVSSPQIIPMDSASQATVVKLTTNLISACTVQALAESLRISRAHGVPAETLLDAIQGNACGSALAAMKVPTMEAEDYDPHFSLSNMLKDSRYAIDLAEKAGLNTPAIRCVSKEMDTLNRKGLGEQDFSILNSQFKSDNSH